MSGKGILGVSLLVVVAAILMGFIYQVDEREKALVFKFGEIIKSDDEPGLHFKLPYPINEVRFYDARVQTLDAEPELYLTREKKNLVVDSFVKWRIRDVAKYYPTVLGIKSNAEARLAQRVNDSLRREFGKRTVKEVVSGDRGVIMDVVRQAVDEEASSLGIEVLDVRLKRVDLDPEISETVYRRMDAERSRVAKDLRAKGAREAERIRATADRERQIIIANARRDAEQIRGDGDAQATAIYAQAFEQDDEFYRLYRSLNAYKKTFGGENDFLIVEPDSEFFRYFKDAKPNQGGGFGQQ